MCLKTHDKKFQVGVNPHHRKPKPNMHLQNPPQQQPRAQVQGRDRSQGHREGEKLQAKDRRIRLPYP